MSNQRLKNIFFLYIFIFVLLVGPYFVFAQTTGQGVSNADLQKQIQDLLKQIQALQQQVSTLQAELGKEPEKVTPTAATPQISSTEVPVSQPEAVPPELTRSLSRGSSGDDVRKLQEFLARDKEIYPDGLITGFFGPKTETAVKKWQEKHKIESVGIIGPKSIAKLQELGRGVIQGLIQQGAGASGVVPPGLLTAPGIQKKIEITTNATSSAATTTSTTATTTPSGTVPAVPAIPAVPSSGVGTVAVPATPATPAVPEATTTVTTTTATTTTATTTTATTTTATTPTATTTTTSADTTPPTFLDPYLYPLVVNVTASSAVVTWVTDENSGSQVDYGLTTNYGNTVSLPSPPVTGHSVSLSQLSASTLYYYKVTSKDAAGNIAVSIGRTFTTLAPPPPPPPPSPSSGGITIDIKANGQDSLSNVPYDSVVTLSWTSSNAASCVQSGHIIPLVQGGTWVTSGTTTYIAFSGNVEIYARHANFGYSSVSTLEAGITCYTSLGPSDWQNAKTDNVRVYLNAPTSLKPSIDEQLASIAASLSRIAEEIKKLQR